MDFKLLATELEKNKNSFSSLLRDVPADLIKWKSSPEKWSLLEIVCHLCDEEKEDFRARLNHVLNTPDKVLPSIDPVGWVEKRNYFEQDFD
ncbi:MAG: DinB family protein, partial [Melioribacteraceae bacterium]|nr:DinB family protein [Melioribacteraceae bacterium]